MEKFSRERIHGLASILLDRLEGHRSIHVLRDRETLLQSLVHGLIEELKRDEERMVTVEERIAVLRGGPRRGTKDWDALFRKLLDEEYDNEGFEIGSR